MHTNDPKTGLLWEIWETGLKSSIPAVFLSGKDLEEALFPEWKKLSREISNLFSENPISTEKWDGFSNGEIKKLFRGNKFSFENFVKDFACAAKKWRDKRYPN